MVVDEVEVLVLVLDEVLVLVLVLVVVVDVLVDVDVDVDVLVLVVDKSEPILSYPLTFSIPPITSKDALEAIYTSPSAFWNFVVAL